MASDQAVVSARVSAGVRDRLKAYAASRGESVRDVVARAVTRLLDEAPAAPPDRAAIVRRLAALESGLRREGVTGLWMFGSVARGDALAASDLDLAVDFAPRTRSPLLTLARIQQDIQEAAGVPVDIGIREDMLPHVREGFRRDAVQVF